MEPTCSDSRETLELLERVRDGDRRALDTLLAQHRPAIRRLASARLDPNLLPRLDESDVVQETQLELARRIDDFLRRNPMPFYLWVRKTTYENLARVRRTHLQAGCRSVAREVALPDRSSLLIARNLLAADSPLREVAEKELARFVREALGRMDEIDREVLQLRALDGLSNQEVAQVLDLHADAVSKRFGRALVRLRQCLDGGRRAGPPA